MERRLHNDEFEDLLRQKADQYRMYPSEKVWKEINRSIHPRKKWYWFGVALLLTSAGYYFADQLIAPAPLAKYTATKPAAEESTADQSNVRQPAQLIPFSNEVIKSEKPAPQPPVNTLNAFAVPALEGINGESALAKVIPIDRPIESRAPWIELATPGDHNTYNSVEGLLAGIDPLPDLQPNASGSLSEASDEQSHRINWLQEQALYELAVPKTKRWSFQVTGSPTMNYRKLTGGKNESLPSSIKNIPFALSVSGDVNNLVNHKPAIGFEVGGSILYALGKNFSLKAGLQFNYSRYYIQAYNAPTEIATIALTDSYGFRADSITNYSSIGNYGGFAANDLQNKYFQLSAPIGAEWKILGNKRLQLNLAGTIQPTYLLNKDSYMITTDMKNYTVAPSLVRRWNVNTAAEAYVSYKAAGLRWQVGPQFRYQLLSSYSSKYPIREFLMEYGVKVGVTKTLR